MATPSAQRPQGVRIEHANGTTTPVELAYRGYDADEQAHVWECITPVARGDRVRVALLPAHTSITLPTVGEHG